MASSEGRGLFAGVLSGHVQQHSLFEDDHEIHLQRVQDSLLLKVQLTRDGLDNLPLQTWMRPGQASLAHFAGALALAPTRDQLWLLQRLPGRCPEDHLLTCLQALLNQRDAWRATVTRLARPAPKPGFTSLRPSSY